MNTDGWLEGGLLTLLLLIGFGLGWVAGKLLGIRMPNAYATTVLLIVGSLGGPAVTYHFLGPGMLSYSLALLLAGLTAGLAFWPMGEKQGEREWL